ncbi:peptidase S10, serine carboxypeptidase [Coccomyxa subellipsoidea C-169]|uniref:Carboxypeptidase n=1 Tax=Coccomyxa subellipsoidea (strain C-169) TaxID=574566 RepID=I0YRC3_COCSC|nr:peptidase S10, serine carboxypeptidase [Coccomyxa subellipsoidea C-169]EIE20942.1 peptidase S10, serine carboxypeptidase [Coccomyxa subellipsoidea C-169]|eukprot:XP_005645486.1 peptidase S10, serine carboxypeptidase [Coccomyxa subellipsoidea C-169]
MRGLLLVPLGLIVLQITTIAAIGASSSRLVEKEIDVHLAADNKHLESGLGKPLRLSGYFKLNRTYDAHMFYFFFEAASEKRHEEPLAVWMTGNCPRTHPFIWGPGCSSELAIFYENGPFRINEDLTLDANEFGWDQTHNMIFVDQPINTGFSYSEDERDRVYDEKVVAADMLDFLKEFRAAHPSYFEAPLFVTGESYGGHYVPAVTYGIFEHNKVAKEPFNLKGLAIGNGLTNPAIQYGSYADFSFANGLISKNVQSTLNAIYPICRFGINACNTLGWDFVCSIALIFCQDTIVAPIQAEGFNVYDIRKPCIGPLCYDFSLLDRYLAQDEVREALGVGDRPWQSCSPDVYNDFLGKFLRDIMRNYEDRVSTQLDAGIKVLIYVGTEDWICNWMGNKRWVSSLAWSQRTAFDKAKEQDWQLDGNIVGTIKAAGPLSFVKVYESGHMVPMDSPAAALDMITSFTHGRDNSSSTEAAGHPALQMKLEKVRSSHLVVQ